MTTKPDSAIVLANLAELEKKLFLAFKAESNDPQAMQLRYTAALIAVANFLDRSGIDTNIANKFVELAAWIDEGNVPFLPPKKASGHPYDSQATWMNRALVVVGLELIVNSGKMKPQAAARYIAKKYPLFHRLKRRSSDSLEGAILNWRRHFDEGQGHEYLRPGIEKFNHPGDPTELFERGRRALDEAAKIVAF
jgi:hypothetical protein